MSDKPQNSMGSSSSVAGNGPIDTYDPIMRIRKRIRKAAARVFDNYNRQDIPMNTAGGMTNDQRPTRRI